MYVHYAAVTLNAIMEGGPFVFRGGPNIADTDGRGGPLIPNIDGPGGPLIGWTISSMTGI